MKTALLFGATGFIGSHLLTELLASDAYAQVKVVVRKPLPERLTTHPKLRVLMGDLSSLPSLETELSCDEVFIALGTTKKHTPDEDEYYKIDHDYPVLAARLAQQKGAHSVYLVSAVGADAGSRFFYVRTKGETERDIRALGFKHTHIFRPSMIVGQREEKRPLETVFIGLSNALDFVFVGGMDKFKGSAGPDIARAMVNAAQRSQATSVQIYQWREMQNLLST